MIKINLAKEKKERRKISPGFDLKGFDVKKLTKAGGEYYLGLLAWIVLAVMVVYYFKIEKEVSTYKEELNRLNQEKIGLQTQAKKLLEEKKSLEDRIADIKKQIEDLERSKDIIAGLKNYYQVFNSSLDFYTSYVPKGSWVNSYRQTLDIDQEVVKTTMDINSFDYQSISSYGTLLGKNSQKIMISPVERKLNPAGFEYYSAKIDLEKGIREER
ncbi:MAG: PilN domain-containing protein [Aquificaceae bacterium]